MIKNSMKAWITKLERPLKGDTAVVFSGIVYMPRDPELTRVDVDRMTDEQRLMYQVELDEYAEQMNAIDALRLGRVTLEQEPK